MATFSTLPIEEGRIAALPPSRALKERYRAYLRHLAPRLAGRLELEEGDRSITERARLKAAAREEGLDL
jgi:hypothetical protein